MSITSRAPFVDLRQQTPGYSKPDKVTSLANLKIPAIKKNARKPNRERMFGT
jgi:hypothetical protein